MAEAALDKSDLGLVLEVLRHYSQRLERFKNQQEADKRYTGVYLDDIGAEINSVVNLTNRIKDMEAVELKGLTVEETSLLAKGIGLFNDDALKLRAEIKNDLPKLELKTAMLDLKLAQIKSVRDKLETEA
jgi:t-SNARE complex subunit (syntaxin)